MTRVCGSQGNRGGYLPFAFLLALSMCGVPRTLFASESAQACLDASSEEMRGEVYIGMAEDGFRGPMQLKPGDKRTLKLFVRRGPWWQSPHACMTWRLATSDIATVDEASGALEVNKDAKHLAVLEVHGRLAGAADDYMGTIVVFRPEANPLVGRWHEKAQLRCKDNSEITTAEAEDSIRDFEIDPIGNYSVTWHPFESYRDYWGTYQFDLEKKTVEFVINDGNFFPVDFSGKGSFSLRPDGSLQLDGVWLGTYGIWSGTSGRAPVNPYVSERFPRTFCGHVFVNNGR